jgi:hypothetical protein
MKTTMMLAALLIGTAAWAEDDYSFYRENPKSVYADAILTEDGFSGGEAGIGAMLFETSEAGLFYSYEENGDRTLQSAGGMINEYYDFGWPLLPFAGVGGGIGFLERDGTESDEEAFLRLQAGARWSLSDRVALSGRAAYSLASEPIFHDGDNFHKRLWDLRIGLKYLY